MKYNSHQTDSSSQNDEVKALQQELDQCWQDDREAKSRMLQAVAAAAAVLSIVYAFVADDVPGDKTSPESIKIICVVITIATMIAAISYIAAMSIITLARYTHMRNLERQIFEKSSVLQESDNGEGRIGWLELRGVLATLRPDRVYNKYAAMHCVGSYLALFGAAIVCICFILLYLDIVENKLSVLIIFLLTVVPFAVIALYTFYQASYRTSKILEQARATAHDSRIEFGEGSDDDQREKVRVRRFRDKANVRWFIRYAVYPRLQDFPKFLFIVFGYIYGFLLFQTGVFSGGAVELGDAPMGLLMTYIVLEYLVYQARYQINDIRGREEDKANPASKTRHRLASMFGEMRIPVILSAIIAAYRIVLAVVLMAFLYDRTGPVYYECIAAIAALAVVYELIRSGSSNGFLLTIVTCMSYSLRVIYGVFCGLVWAGAGSGDLVGYISVFPIPFVVLVIAAFFLGLAVSTMLRRLEAVEVAKAGSSDYPKKHVARIAERMDISVVRYSPAPLLDMRSDMVRWLVPLLISIGALLVGCLFSMSGIVDGNVRARMSALLFGTILLIALLLVSSFCRGANGSGVLRLAYFIGSAGIVAITLLSINGAACLQEDSCQGGHCALSLLPLFLVALLFAVYAVRRICFSSYGQVNNMPYVVGVGFVHAVFKFGAKVLKTGVPHWVSIRYGRAAVDGASPAQMN